MFALVPAPPSARLCHFTYVVTRHRSRLTGLDPATLSTAVLGALLRPDLTQGQEGHDSREGQQAFAADVEGSLPCAEVLGGRTYDLVMLLRHLCQLNPQPPAGRHCRGYLLSQEQFISILYLHAGINEVKTGTAACLRR